MNTQRKATQTIKKIKIIIERSNDSYSAYAANVTGIYGQGNTVDEAKQSALTGLELLKKYNTEENLPAILKGNYEIVFKFDTESFLNFYKKIFTNAALERMTGINQKQFQHYASGLKKPRLAQVKKIETAIHSLGRELMSVEL
jgi:predicted RNase H-like HicB family nuclease